jgi:hypothetical protein
LSLFCLDILIHQAILPTNGGYDDSVIDHGTDHVVEHISGVVNPSGLQRVSFHDFKPILVQMEPAKNACHFHNFF